MNPRNFFLGRTIVFILILLIGFVAYFILAPKKNIQNATYTIEGKKVTLVDGKAETSSAASSSIKIITTYFGNEAKADLNNDGREDSVFIITQQPGGSGTFYYVVAALNTKSGYIGSSGVRLGDRIAPQSIEIGDDKQITVNYADRALFESFVVPPSVGKTATLIFNPNTLQFGKVIRDFEGEANPSMMTLGMKKWNWIGSSYNNGDATKPRKADAFTIHFNTSNTFRITTDCNGGEGQYTYKGDTIKLDKIMSTEMACGDSQESEFKRDLSNVTGFHFTSKGELLLDFKSDGGSMTFR